MHILATLDLDATAAVYLKIDKQFNRNSAHAEQCAITRSLLSQPALKGLIAAPQPRDVTTIAIVAPVEMVGNPSDEFPESSLDFQNICTQLQLKTNSIHRPDGFVIEQCIRYSLSFWLERKGWCRVGDSLMQSSFLGGASKNERLIRVEAGVHCGSSGDLFLQIRPSIVRLFVMEPWFISDDAALKFDPKWVVCLPRLGRGRVIGVHRRIPPESPFQNWNQMRNYWLNAYGYHLPISEPDALYDIQFNGMHNSFLYPYYCILNGEPEPMSFRDSPQVLVKARESFIEALNSCHVNICGHSVKVEVSEGRADARLAYASVLSLPVVKKAKGTVISTVLNSIPSPSSSSTLYRPPPPKRTYVPVMEEVVEDRKTPFKPSFAKKIQSLPSKVQPQEKKPPVPPSIQSIPQPIKSSIGITQQKNTTRQKAVPKQKAPVVRKRKGLIVE